MLASLLNGARIAIIGGTGSLGKQIVSRLLKYEPQLIRVMSREEKKQVDMRRSLYDYSNIEFFIGDVRDRFRVRELLSGIDIVINTAALKHVPICEEVPIEAVLTNVIGAINVRRESIAAGTNAVVSICTDKAIKPVNVLGMTKALQERITLSSLPHECKTKFLSVRYGNVIGSSGSVVPLFCNFINKGEPIPITNSEMTRFVLTLDEAVDTIFSALENGSSGEVWVRRSPAVNILDLGKAIAIGLSNNNNYPVTDIGIRPGEKIHEVLVSSEEIEKTRIEGDYYCISPQKLGNSISMNMQEYCSKNEKKLSSKQIAELLCNEGWLQQ